MSSQISNHHSELRLRYGVIVIGSGYGGAITAARLAQAGHDVCVLERGKEWPTGSFPDEAGGVVEELKTSSNPLGLYEYIRGDDLDIFCGSGLGGTSLINANVAIRPDDDVLSDPRWPREIRDAVCSGAFDRYLDRVAHMLQITRARPDGPPLTKVDVHHRSAAGRPGAFRRLDVTVNLDKYDDQPNHVGVPQKLCTLCGDCVTGCNVGAKNNLPMNYLPLAVEHGSEIYTQIEVDFIVPDGSGGYHVIANYRPDCDSEPITHTLHARAVVVAAGVMGTAGIMLRSRLRGLALSSRLGHAFSSNGDLIGLGYNNDVRTDVVGFGARSEENPDYTVGPTILSMIDYRDRTGSDRDHGKFIIEEGAIPRALVSALRRAAPLAAFLDGQDTDAGFRDKAHEIGRVLRDLARRDPDGALNHSMVYLGIGHDGADGRIRLGHDGSARVMWGALPDGPVFKALSAEMRELVTNLGGTYIANPRGLASVGNNEVTVHPLGGCAMADDRRGGVVNHAGQVFDPRSGDDAGVYDDLMIADASVIPTSLGVNPFYTISALAERIADQFNARHSVPVIAVADPPPAPLLVAPRPGLEFTEEMAGHCNLEVTTATTPDAFVQAAAAARHDGIGALRVHLTITTDDVEELITSESHEAEAAGYVDSTLFGRRRRVEQGSFNLFIDDGERRMRYKLRFVGEDEQRYLLDGYKTIRDDPGADMWTDTTTLFTNIRSGWSDDDPVVAQGVLRIGVKDLIAQLSTFRVRHSDDPAESIRVLARFGAFFFGTLWETYLESHLGSGWALGA